MLAAIALIIALSLYRLIPVFLGMNTTQPDWLINFSPLAALCLCGAAALPRRVAIALPFTALLGTDLILNWHYSKTMPGDFALINAEFAAKTLAFLCIATFGWKLRGKFSLRTILPAAFASSLFFYIVTNTASWLFEPLYTKNLTGWIQALTIGLPQFQPTWMFYRNTFASDLLFSLLFLACLHRHPSQSSLPSPIPSSSRL